jgi:predicted kinase
MKVAQLRTLGVGAIVFLIVMWLLRRYLQGPGKRPSSRSGSGSRPKSSSSKSSSSRSGSKRSSSGAPAPDPSLPDFVMLVGIPGSGKTTWAKKYVFQCDASFTIVSSDEVRTQLTGDLNDQSRNEEVWEIVFEHVRSALHNKRNVILDATNTLTDKRRRFFSKLPACNRYAKLFQVNKSIAKNRISKDLEEGVVRAQVPDAVIDKMQAQFNESLQTIKDEGWMFK